MNVTIRARVYDGDVSHIVEMQLQSPHPSVLPDITPEDLEALLQHSLLHDIIDPTGSCQPKLTIQGVDEIAPRVRYRKSMVQGEDDCKSCAICLVEFKPRKYVRRLPCDHLFCSACISKWVSDHSASCPVCRATITLNEV